MERSGNPGGGPGRKRGTTPEQGIEGKRRIPRSMAMTFEYIRRGMWNESQDRFGQRLADTFSSFPEDERTDPKPEKPRARISAYEKAERHIAFGTQHKYATLSETYTGVIHLISLFYAYLRCAANARENDAVVRAKQLNDAVLVARKLRALADVAEELAVTAHATGLLERLKDEAWEDRDSRFEHELAVIKPLFDAFKKIERV
jgi:hypothetical protein